MFHNVLVDPPLQAFQLMIGFLFDNPEWEQHPIVILCKALVFGIKQSLSFCEAALSYVAQQLNGMARIIMLYGRLVDNVVFSTRDRTEAIAIETAIREKLKEYGFPLKEMDTLKKVLKDKFTLGENPTQLLGMTWDRDKDLLLPNWKLNLHENYILIVGQTTKHQ